MIKAQCIFKRRKKGNRMSECKCNNITHELLHSGIEYFTCDDCLNGVHARDILIKLKASQNEVLYLNLERDCLLDWVERLNPHLNAESIECSLTCTIEPRYKELKR